MIYSNNKKSLMRKYISLILVFMMSVGIIKFPYTGDLYSKAAVATDLFFSEYIEGYSNNKAVEIFNGTDQIVDLSNYSIELYSNGSASVTSKTTLSGKLESGKTYVIAHPSANADILGKANTTSTVINFNGNDAFVLKSSEQIVDVIGQVGFDPGTQWGSGNTSTLDHTLVRKSSITIGDLNKDNAFDPSIQWDGYAKDDASHLGSHTMDNFGSTPIDSPTNTPVETPIVTPTVTATITSAATPTDSQTGVISIAASRAKADAQVVTVTGTVICKGIKVFIQDDTAAINLYTQKNSTQYDVGDIIKVTGSILNYNGVMEITNFTVDQVISSGNPIPMTTLTIDQIGEDDESVKIKLEGVKIGTINTSGNTILTDSSNRTIPIYKAPALSGIFEGDIVDVIAYVSEFKGTYQLYVNVASDITKSQTQPVDLEPVFYGMKPAKSETTYTLKPEISIKYEEGSKSLPISSIVLKIDNVSVAPSVSFDTVSKTGKAVYTPTNDLTIGEHDVYFEIKDSTNKSFKKNWYFTIIQNVSDYNAYFGIPHAHTSYSDGQGTPSSAFLHAFNKSLDFLAVTDHSNQLEGDSFDSVNNQFVATAGSEWTKTKEMADKFNSEHPGKFLAMRAFEWTHGSNGHMNVFNTSNYTEAKKTMTEIGDLYDWIEKVNGIGAFNHPNWPSDSFNNLTYDEDADRVVKTIEVGNGAPPYSYARSIEYFYKALDMGWHVGAINAQDNHSENWGDPDNLTGVLAKDLTYESYLEAVKAHRVYSTETRDLLLKMKANGYWMGSVLDLEQGQTLNFDISASDNSDPIDTIELITNGGKTIATKKVDAVSVVWTPQVVPGSGSNWHVVKVTHKNGKIGMSSPIWTTGDDNDLKLTELAIDSQPALPGVASSVQATVTNFGARPVNNVEVKFYHTSVAEENLIGKEVLTSVAAGSNRIAHIDWTPSVSGERKIIAKLTEIPGVTTVTELSNTILVVAPINKKVLIDQYHGNADVPGTMGDFVKFLRIYGYKAEFSNQTITESLLSGTDVFVLGAPGETKSLSAAENTAISNWVKSGGSLLIADKSNYGYNNMLLNSTMETMGSGIRFNDDNVYEPETSDKYSGGMVWSAYMETFPASASGLNKNMKSLRIFSGCSLVNANGQALVNNPDKGLEVLLCGNSTSYNYEPGLTDQSKGTVMGANNGYSYMYNTKGSTNGNKMPVIAKEQVGNGKVLAAGRHFYSDYEIVNDTSNTSFTLNVIDWLSGYNRIKDIDWVRKNAQPGTAYTVKGKVTAPTNLFYDSMYIQDETGGICLYGNQKAELRLGEEVIATGIVKEFEGEKELSYQDFTNDVLYIGPAGNVQPVKITTKYVANGLYIGKLVVTQGKVVEVNKPASYFKINDGSSIAYIHVDGYLGIDIDTLKVGDEVSVTGIASVGAASPRIRVRYAGDLVKKEISHKHIIVIHTNDTHGRIKAGDGMGFARIYTKVKELEEKNPGSVLVLDAGDTLHGQPIITISRGEAMARIMNKIGYDTMAPGNHDFNYGKDILLELDGFTNFPMLSANILKEDGTPFFTPYIIKDVNGVKVGIFGLSTPETLYKTNPKNVEGLTFKDPIQSAREMVAELKGKTDVIIAISHLGLDEGSVVKSSDVAEGVSGIDLIIDGHSHTVLPQGKIVNGTMIAQTGEYDKNLGLVDIKVGSDGSKTCTAELLSKEQAATIPEDPEMLSIIAQLNAENSVITSEVVGNTEIELDGTRNHVRSNETNLGNLIADAMKKVADADVAITNGGGIRANINVGEITKGEIINVLPFGNYVVLKEVTGADILAALENGFSKYPAYDGRFPHISGMRVVFDPTKAALSRVVSVMVGNAPLDLKKIYRLATNDFVAAGGDQYTVFANDAIKGEFAALDEVLAQYIKTNGTANAKKDRRITSITSGKIAVFSDPHYYSPQLGTQGAAFAAYLAQDRKLIAESSAISRAAIDAIKASDANIVLVPGDLTKDGEKISHQEFAALLSELESAGKKVYVICGNHDINNPESNTYLGENATRVDNITPVDFKNIYNNFGYGEAIAKDSNSLSYVVEPVPGMWIIAMDACHYDINNTLSHPETYGSFKPEAYAWIKEQLKEAKAQGKYVIGLMHHGVLEHYTGQKQLFSEYVIDNWETVSSELADLGMKAVFTGHYHAQDIVSKATAAGNKIYDIETGSLVSYPNPYRLVDITTDSISIKSFSIKNIDYNTGDKTFQEYSKEFLETGIRGLVPYMLAGQLMQMNPALTQQEAFMEAVSISDMKPAPTLTTMTIRDMLTDAMVKHYQGDETVNPIVFAVLKSMASSTDPKTKMLGGALVSLYNDLSPEDNNLEVYANSRMIVSSAASNPGKDVTTNVALKNLINVAGLKVKLTYDKTKLSLKNVLVSQEFGGASAVNTTVPGEIIFNAVSAVGITKDTMNIATITFTINKDCQVGDTAIQITNVETCDEDTKDIPVTVGNGTITVENLVLPVASNVTFIGEAVVGHTLTAQYSYSDGKNRPEVRTKIRWLKAEHGSSDYTEITGASGKTMVVTKELAGKDIIVEVTPSNNEDIGLPAIGHNNRNKVIRSGDVNKDGKVNFVDALILVRYITGKITLGTQEIAAADIDGIDSVNINDVIVILKKDIGLTPLD